MLTIRTHAGEIELDLDEFERRVVRGEIAPDTPVCFPLVTGDAWVPARDLEIFRGLYRPDRIYFMRYFNLSRFPWITAALVLANLLVFVMMRLEMGAGEGAVTAAMVDFGAKARPLILDLGETWRFLTANFVHRDWVHLLFNLFVLFNVGGALDNAFRPLDYLFILLASALGTTVLSFFGSAAVSAGASGVVFGCFGGVIVFGLKYREIIPPRYRRFFGSSVIPYVVVFLWIGWMSSNTDNWGHLGGLIGGSLATFALEPRLLQAGVARRRRTVLRAAALLAIVLTVVFAGRLMRPLLPVLRSDRDDEFGIEIAYPVGWGRSITELGWLGVSNRLRSAGPTYLHVFTEQRAAPIDLTRLADDWFDLQLHYHEHMGRVRRVRRSPPQETTVAGEPALRYDAAFELMEGESQGRSYLLRLYVFARGDLGYTLVFLAPESRFARYEPVFDRMLAQVRLAEPAFLRQARAAVLLAPTDPSAYLDLGEAWARVGEGGRAEQALRMALRLSPAEPGAYLALARLLLGDPARRSEGFAAVQEALRLLPYQAEPLELLADYYLAEGRLADARAALEAALEREPRNGLLRDRLRELTSRLR
ncbi:MAG: rhomboid family intramembrane serine protease [Deltaproteobacteria bacterium]|nr:MAG: rhomboid family intramembrane serine protease [Deltaproteobacteria bacterium]